MIHADLSAGCADGRVFGLGLAGWVESSIVTATSQTGERHSGAWRTVSEKGSSDLHDGPFVSQSPIGLVVCVQGVNRSSMHSYPSTSTLAHPRFPVCGHLIALPFLTCLVKALQA